MSLSDLLAEDRRLGILRALDAAQGGVANDAVLATALAYLGHEVAGDIVRADLAWLAAHGLVEIEDLGTQRRPMLRVRLREAGQDVARGRLHPGVAPPRAAP